jgi:hypothetical protein
MIIVQENSLQLAIFEAPLLSISQDLEAVSIEGESGGFASYCLLDLIPVGTYPDPI